MPTSVSAPELSAPEASHPSRILALRGGEPEPLLNEVPAGSPSPSPSLVIERFEVDQPGEHSQILMEDVVTLFLKPASLRHRRGDSPATQVHLNAGDAVICVRNDRQSMVWNSPMSALCVQIAGSVLSETARSLMKRDHARLEPTLNAVNPSLTSLLWALEAEQMRGYPAGRLFLDSLETALATVLITSHNTTPSTPVVNRGGLAPRLLRRVLEFMHHSISRQVALTDLAAVTGLSPSHFAHQFRAGMGMSPYKYMRALRIDHSKTLLKNRDLTVLDVATAVGFDNQQHFATVFRSVVGVTPSTYRQAL